MYESQKNIQKWKKNFNERETTGKETIKTELSHMQEVKEKKLLRS